MGRNPLHPTHSPKELLRHFQSTKIKMEDDLKQKNENGRQPNLLKNYNEDPPKNGR
jgi:hypothetical protein